MGLKEILTNALVNTLLGMGTVFLVLIFISLVISLFKFLPKEKSPEEKAANKARKAARRSGRPESAEAPASEAPAAPQAAGTAGTASDGQLVAVIMAAVSAYKAETESEVFDPDMYVVRSIKRRSREA